MKNGNKKLRIGILLDSSHLPAWAVVMLEQIKDSHYGLISLVILNHSQGDKLRGKSIKNIRWDVFIYTLYRMIDALVFKYKPDAFKTKDASALLSGSPVIKVIPNESKKSDHFNNEDIEKINSYKLDVLVQLGFRRLSGKILRSAKYGVWAYFFGENPAHIGDLAGLWEVLYAQPATESNLQILEEDRDQGKVIYRSYAATHVSSVNKSLNPNLWKSLSFLPRRLEDLYALREEKFFQKVESQNINASPPSEKHYNVPHNRVILIPLLKHFTRGVVRKISELFFNKQWILLFNLNKEDSTSFHKYHKIIPPKDRQWADPFVIHKNGKYYIFIEEYLNNTGKGFISVFVLDENGQYSKPVKIIDKPYHLSYPFVFEWGGEFYMIPESFQNKSIEMYKCSKFPDQWELHKILMEDVVAVDPTLFFHDQRWWLFAGVRENDGATLSEELFLFYTDSLFSDDWTPHPLNPIISDVRNARPAGKFFQKNGNIYRPSQNCSIRYGYGLKINQVLILNECEYKEKEIYSFEPNWDQNIIGLHSFNREDDLTVIDAISKRSKWLYL